MRLNVARMDSKGRISIPMALRHYMRLNHGDELVLSTTSNELRLIPADMGNTEIQIKFKKYINFTEPLAQIMQVLARQKIDVVTSEVEMHDSCAGWRAVLNTDDYKKLKSELSSISTIKDISIKKNILA